jgi:hypothetical protein
MIPNMTHFISRGKILHTVKKLRRTSKKIQLRFGFTFQNTNKNIEEAPLPEGFSTMTGKMFFPNGIVPAKLAGAGGTGGCVAP